MEKASPIDVDAAESNTVVVYSKIEELRAECEVAWAKVARPLEQLIKENNLTVMGLKCQSHSTLRLPTCYEHLLALINPC